MTRLEELKAACEAASVARADAHEAARNAVDAAEDAEEACHVAWDAYYAELKTQEENSND